MNTSYHVISVVPETGFKFLKDRMKHARHFPVERNQFQITETRNLFEKRTYRILMLALSLRKHTTVLKLNINTPVELLLRTQIVLATGPYCLAPTF